MMCCQGKFYFLAWFQEKSPKKEAGKGIWYIAVAKDAVVPIVSAKNPILQQLLNKGISKEKLIKIFVTGEIDSWGQIYSRQKDK